MYIEGTGFYTCKECHKTEFLRNHTATAHREREQLGDRRNVGESSCNCGDGTGQMAQPLMFMMMMMMMTDMQLLQGILSLRLPWRITGKVTHQLLVTSALDGLRCLLQASAAQPRGSRRMYTWCGPHSWSGDFRNDISLLLPPAALSRLQPGHYTNLAMLVVFCLPIA
jgi:hypothetical protein